MMSYNYSGVPQASMTPIMSNLGMGPTGPMMAGGPQSFMNPMITNQPPAGNMILPSGPGMNDSPLEFNMNKNNPPMPLESSSSRAGSDDDYSNNKNDLRRDRGRRNNRRERDRREDRRNSRDRDRIREKEGRRGSSEDPPSSTTSGNLQRATEPSPTVNPGMWSGVMGMGYPMMGMIMDPTNIMGMNNYGTLMQPLIQPDGTLLPADTTIDPLIPPAGPMVKEVIHCKSCTLYPPSPTAPVPTTRERPPGCRTVFVGGLPENITEEILTEVFEKCGEITTLRLSKKNFCHIRFMYETSVDAAIYLSGYRIRIGNNSDPPNSGRLHVDYAQARDDQYEWECKQRALMREQRHRERMEEERLRPPSPPPVQHYTEHEAATVADKIKQDESFPKAVQVIITWLERGDCNKRNANTFYSMIQSTNSHVRRLLAEKTQYEEELQKAKEIMKGRMQGLLIQFGQIERVFAAASHKKVWDHFTKAQRKNIDMWKKQTQEIKSVQLEDVFNERADEEMDVSDNDENESMPRKRQRVADTTSDEKNHLKEENDSLRCQLEAYKNEVDLVRSDLQSSLDTKEKQLQMLQQTLKGMQKQLLDSMKKQSEDDAKVKDLQAQLESRTPDKECTIIDLDASDSPTTKSDESQLSNVTSSVAPAISEHEAKLIGLISIFLHVHPFGAGVDYIWSYLQKLETSLKPSDVENIMSKFPTIFKQELSGIGANMERRWQFNGLQMSNGVIN